MALASLYDSLDGAPLVDGNAALVDAATCLAVASLRALMAGADSHEGVREALVHLTDPMTWPVFTVETSAGVALHAVWRNFDEDAGNDLFLQTRSGATHLLSTLEGHWMWPGLRWQECVDVSNAATNLDAQTALLVLLPFAGDALPTSAEEVIARAIHAVGASLLTPTVEDLMAGSTMASPIDQSPWGVVDGVVTCRQPNCLRGAAASLEFRAMVEQSLALP